MFSFVQNWFAAAANPIGIDFGSDGLRMAQVEEVDGDFKLVAAARADVPNHVRNDPAAKLAFFSDTARDLFAQGNFRGRRVVLSLPASVMSIQHVRMAKMDEAALKQALPWECRGRLPYDPSHALLRHMVAGEVFAEGEQRNEIIVMAAKREWVNQLLAAAAKAKLDVIGMNVEPKATVDCFANVYRRKSDTEIVNMFVDIGCSATRAVVAKGTQILFARVIPIGGDHFTRAVAAAKKVGFEDAKILRIKLCHALALTDLNRSKATTVRPRLEGDTAHRRAEDLVEVETVEPTNQPGTELGGHPLEPDALQVETAIREPLDRLVQELSLCRRYHEATFPALHIGRLVFVGGEARHRSLCQQIAQSMDLAAQVGDPMVRMGRTTTVGPESGIDRRLPQPDWVVPIGLSMGAAKSPMAECQSPGAQKAKA